MKKLLLMLFVFTCSINYAQKQADSEINSTKSTVHSLKFTVDDAEELKTINWDDIKEIFSKNSKQDSISLGFELKSKSKNKTHYSFTIKGKTDDVDGLILLSKRAIKILNKI